MKRVLSMVFAVLLVSGTSVWAATAEVESTVKVCSGSFSGTLNTSEGKPLADTTIEIANADGKVVTSITTNSTGKYKVDFLAEGKYTVSVAGVMQGDLVSTPNSEVKVLHMFIPSPNLPPAPGGGGGALGAGAGGGAGGGLLSGWSGIAISAGIATAISSGIAVAVSNSNKKTIIISP